MPLIARRRDKPLDQLSDKALQRKVREATAAIVDAPDRPPVHEITQHLATLEAASRDRAAAQAELDRRAQAAKDAQNADFRRRVQASGRPVQAKALDLVAAFSHPELAGVSLSPARLDDPEAKELLGLAQRRRGDDHEAGPLADEEEARYVELVERAAGEPGMFERRRAERAEQEKLDAFRAAEKRLPQASSLVAAVMAEEDLFEGLQRKLRTDALVLDEFGRQLPGAVAARIYEPDNVVALFLCVSRIVENGGHDIEIDEHGNLGEGLPRLPSGSLAQLRRNGWLTTAQEGAGTRVGLGERTRSIAAKWAIDVPPGDGSD